MVRLTMKIINIACTGMLTLTHLHQHHIANIASTNLHPIFNKRVLCICSLHICSLHTEPNLACLFHPQNELTY